MIKLIEKTKNKDDKFYSDLIDKYNILLKTAKHIKDNNLKVKMREMSNKTILDVNKISAMPILKNIDKN